MSEWKIAGLTEAQRNCLIGIARFLDAAAGEGFGLEVEYEDGTKAIAFADDLVVSVADAFGLERTDSNEPLGRAIINILAEQSK